MGLLGGAAVAIWHDIEPAGRAAFYAWHGQEHMPERVAIPGFLRGRRYIAIEADREFFNLYETSDEGVVNGPDYKARLDNPTPWTLQTVKHFRAVARSLCRVESSLGTADGGIIATLRCDLSSEDAVVILRGLLAAVAARPGIAAVHLLAANLQASSYVNAEQRARGASNEVPSQVLLVEGWADEAPFLAVIKDALESGGLQDKGALGFYRHQITTSKSTT